MKKVIGVVLLSLVGLISCSLKDDGPHVPPNLADFSEACSVELNRRMNWSSSNSEIAFSYSRFLLGELSVDLYSGDSGLGFLNSSETAVDTFLGVCFFFPKEGEELYTFHAITVKDGPRFANVEAEVKLPLELMEKKTCSANEHPGFQFTQERKNGRWILVDSRECLDALPDLN